MLVGLLLVVFGVVVVVRNARRVPRRSATSGFSAQLLRSLAQVAPAERRQWIDAMLAEHDAIDDPAQRRRFARAACAALWSPPAGATPPP